MGISRKEEGSYVMYGPFLISYVAKRILSKKKMSLKKIEFIFSKMIRYALNRVFLKKI